MIKKRTTKQIKIGSEKNEVKMMKGDDFVEEEQKLIDETNEENIELENLSHENDLDASKSSDPEVRQSQKKQSIRKDLHNIALLLFLYFLQGVPLGLTGSLPLILSSRKASYADQGTFSFAFWPFSLKLLWAPIVDSIYFKKLGRRKSWLVPIQYLIGIFMLSFSNYVHELIEGNQNETAMESSRSGYFS